MSSGMGRSVDSLNRELAATRLREKELREAVARAAKQHDDDTAKIQRLEARAALDVNANKISQLEQRIKALQEERQNLRVQLEAAGETEAALRNELAVFHQIEQWEEYPDLRAMAVTTVRARELESRVENAEGQCEVAQRRADELTDELRELVDALRERDEALLAAGAENDRLADEALHGREALKENALLRQQLADLEAELEELRDEVSVLRPKVTVLEQEAIQHRASWKSSRDFGNERDAAAKRAESALETLQQEHAKTLADLRNAQRDIESNVLEIAALRKREAQWDDEHGMLEDERADANRLRVALNDETRQRQHAESLCRALEVQRDSNAASIADYRSRLTNTESQLETTRNELQGLHLEFLSLERQAGRQAVELEQCCVAASAETGSLRIQLQALEKENQLLKSKVSAMKAEAVHSVTRVTKAASEMVASHVSPSSSPPASQGRPTRSPTVAAPIAAETLDAVTSAADPPGGFFDASKFTSRPGLRRMHRRDFGAVTPPRGVTGNTDAPLYHLSPQTPPML